MSLALLIHLSPLLAQEQPPKKSQQELKSQQQPLVQLGHASKDTSSESREAAYSFKFENTRFYVSLITIELDSYGAGELKFKRGESDDLVPVPVKLQPATLARIGWLLDSVKFVDSEADYQGKKDFSHLGWITIGARQSGRERTVRFNWTTNPAIYELSEVFRGIATQEIDLFDIELARQHQPLDLPQQLETLENDLKLERVTEPSRLLTPLGEIVNDDTVPLIARNVARRITKSIEKGQFKTPIKAAR